MARRKVVPIANRPQAAARHKRKREPKQMLFTIEDAFDHRVSFRCIADLKLERDADLAERHFDVERGLRAIAFLLASTTQEGNRDLDGQTAVGLSLTLERYASEINSLERARRVRQAGRS